MLQSLRQSAIIQHKDNEMDYLLCNISKTLGSLPSPKSLEMPLVKIYAHVRTLLKTLPKLPLLVGSHFKSQCK